LYEGSIWSVRVVEKKAKADAKAKEEADAQAAGSPPDESDPDDTGGKAKE
jgi:hypothetical protein